MQIKVPATALQLPKKIPPAGVYLVTVNSIAQKELNFSVGFGFLAINRPWTKEQVLSEDEIVQLAHAMGMTGDVNTDDMVDRALDLPVVTTGGKTGFRIKLDDLGQGD